MRIVFSVPLFGVILAASSITSAMIAQQPLGSTSNTSMQNATAPTMQKAQVDWVNGQLRVSANNSSLNSILRDISLRTGMKISGGVEDEHVFGTYGPGSAASVLQQLLDGTKCNMMLQSDQAMLPIQLTLTPLGGGPTPPSPMQVQVPESAPTPPQAPNQAPSPQGPGGSGSQRPPRPPYRPQGPPPDGGNAANNESGTATDAPPAPPDDASSSNADSGMPTNADSDNANSNSDSSSDQSGNGAKTPQQIFEELQKLHQKQQ